MPNDISPLIAQLNSDDAKARAAAAEQLAESAESAQPAAVPLARAAADADEAVREWAIAALEALGPPSDADAAALAELLASDAADTAYWAATLLGRLGESAALVAGAVANALNGSPHLAIRDACAWALGKIGLIDESTLPALRRAAAEDSHPRLARLARRAIDGENE